MAHSPNAFTFFRLLLALAVVVSHGYYVGGFGHDPLWALSGGQVTAGTLAVLGFFVTEASFPIAAMRMQEWPASTPTFA